MHIKCTLNRVWLAIFLLAILSWRTEAEIGFKHIPAWELMIDPIRQPPEMGFMSVLWDSLSVDTLEQDATLSNISEIDSALSDSGVTQPDSTYLPDIDPNKLPGIDPTATGALIDPLIDKGSEASSSDPDKSHISDKEKKRRDQYSPEEEEPEDEEDPPEYHPTIVKRSDYPVEYKAVIDTSTNFVVVRPRIGGSELPFSGAIDPDTYIQRSIERSDWESWRKSVLNKFPKKSEKERGAIEIFIPVIKGKLARRIFGGPNIGLSVTGDISINGGLKTENREQLQRDNQSNTNVAFKMDQTQRFHITGSVGEKVEVSIDQDSERLFEFENNLRISYKGNPDEIIQSIEAGNVSLTLPRTRLISGSARHQGLFGLKITSQVGPLKLTTIASLDKGEKKSKNIEGGAESQRKKIDPRDFIQNKYFFLDDIYRENYRRLNSKNLSHFAIDSLNQIVDWRVYKSISAGETQASTRGWAHANPDDPDTSETTQEHQVGLFTLLTERIDYTINTQTGWIRLNQQWLNAKDILAVSYLDGYGIWHGELREGGEELSLKLIRPESPKPDDSTWELMWRHVYSLGATGIDWEGFSGRIEGIIGKDGERKTQETYAFVDGALNFIDYRLFGLDYLGASGEAANPDGMIDQAFLNLPLGELHFPDLRPFDPEGWYFDNSFTLIGTKLRDEDSTLFSPAIYDEPSSYRSKIVSDFDIIVEYENVSASYNLGFLVLEGSEEVILNGRRLTRGADYTMDYNSSELVILDPEATAAGADLEIKWETGSLVSLDSKTILGIRAEYGLWDDSYIGTTIMYRSQKTQDRRIRVGSEPVKNSIWDINAALVFRPDFLTRAIDWLPLIETNKESKFTIEGEVAQIYPNPNSLNSPSTGDNNGVAYVDDFESIKRSLPLGITRKRWNHASFPEYDMRGEFLWAKKRGRIIWYNPIGREPVKDIWPEKEVQATDSKTDVLKVEFQPYWDEWGADNPGDDQIQRNHWGGIMRYLGAGFADQTQSKYIEIWLNRGSITSGEMYIDLGHITEDVIPNFVLDTEDMPEVGFLYGDNILDSGEDIGFDGIAGNDGGEAQDSVDINGDGILYPSYDDYEERNDSKINGTEGNRNINNYPDTEDLDGDKYLDQTNSFFRYKIDFTEGDNNRYIAGGLSNTKGWRLYRIPLVDTMSIGDASLDAIEYARLWFTGFKQKGSIRIAQIDIVGNEWLEDAVGPSGKETEPIKVAVINTHDNPPPEYIPPPGVSGELDPVTNQRAKEQSLVLKIDKLNTGETGSISKRIQKGIDLLDYKFLKLFVHGGNYTEQLTDRMGRELNLDMFFRFGDNDKNYYEYSQRLFPGWSPHNEIIIDMERLSSIKFLREQDSLRNYDILPNGDVIRVVGNPTLGKLRFLVFGVKNHGRPITAVDNIEIWVDELRVSDVHRNPGWAARGSVSLNLADLIDISASMDQKDANFHGVDKKLSPVGSSQSLTGNMDIKIHLDKFFNPQWGLRLPLSGHFNQKIKIPKFKPNSDILLSALGGEQVSAFSIFSETLTSNSRFSNNPVYTSPSDSLISLSKRYSINTSLSKSKKSDNIFVHYTMDQFSLDGIEHSETYSSDERYLYKKEIRNKATMTYKFPIDDPIKLNWLGWTRNLPFMNRYSESLLQPLPRSLTVNARGEEYDQIKKTRNEKVKPPLYTFKISRSYNLSWQPLSILGMNFGQTFAGEQHRDELRRTEIARNQVDIDSTQYFVINPDDSSATFDSTAYADAVEQELSRVKDEIYWKLGGLYFIDRSMNQNFSTNFRPEILSWLNTDANYSSRYTWGWSETFGPGDRSVSTSSSFSTSLTFRLQSLMRAWDDKAKDKLESSGKPGNSPPDEGIYDNIPPPDNPFDELDRYNDPIPDPGSLSPEVLIGEESKDSIEVAGDSLVVKKPRPHPLAPLKFVLRRLKDIRYQYSLSNNPRNNSMEPGQARWKYRLGITTDPGLDHVAGWEIRDSNSRQDRHTISSGFDITQNLRLSTISYNVNKAENITFYSGRSGSNSSTAWHYFQDGDSAPKSFPILNYSASWSGLSQLEFVKRFANSINVTNSFSGNKSETWQFRRIDSVRTVNTISYDKSFSPLLGMSFNWKKGISSTMGYNFSQRVEENHSMNSKTRNVNESMTFQTNYTSRKGFRIPIPVWPFKNRRFKNSTSFAIQYQFSRDRRETSNNDEDFSDPSTSTSWSVSPSIDYSFSSTVKGGFDYEYGVRRTQQQGKVKSQEFSFRVNISIRG